MPCDTAVAMHDVTADGSVIFMKNSDRDPNEAATVEHHPRRSHAGGRKGRGTVKCTYIEVPQVASTHAVLLCKPAWIWGAEIGANEHGVCIGNEAMFSATPVATDNDYLLGMDLVRLALERASSARDALAEMTRLLEEHGQGGECGFDRHMVYHNGFLIADGSEAWILETVGKAWAAERVVSGVRSISNRLSIGNKFDLCSHNLVEDAIGKGTCKSRDDFSFARCYGGDWLHDHFGQGYERRCATRDSLDADRGNVTVESAFATLQGHTVRGNQQPDQGFIGVDVCMHAGTYPVRVSQTTMSLVSHIPGKGKGKGQGKGQGKGKANKGGAAASMQQTQPAVLGEATHWVTGTACPCLSVFKPTWVSCGNIWGPMVAQREARSGYDGSTMWWKHEVLHRNVLLDYPARRAAFIGDRDALQAEFVSAVATLESQAREMAVGGGGGGGGKGGRGGSSDNKHPETEAGGGDGGQRSGAAGAADAAFARRVDETRRALAVECVRRADAATSQWIAKVAQVPATRASPWWYRREWTAANARALVTNYLTTGPDPRSSLAKALDGGARLSWWLVCIVVALWAVGKAASGVGQAGLTHADDGSGDAGGAAGGAQGGVSVSGVAVYAGAFGAAVESLLLPVTSVTARLLGAWANDLQVRTRVTEALPEAVVDGVGGSAVLEAIALALVLAVPMGVLWLIWSFGLARRSNWPYPHGSADDDGSVAHRLQGVPPVVPRPRTVPSPVKLRKAQ